MSTFMVYLTIIAMKCEKNAVICCIFLQFVWCLNNKHLYLPFENYISLKN